MFDAHGLSPHGARIRLGNEFADRLGDILEDLGIASWNSNNDHNEYFSMRNSNNGNPLGDLVKES